jgi:hypothetical protein
MNQLDGPSGEIQIYKRKNVKKVYQIVGITFALK